MLRCITRSLGKAPGGMVALAYCKMDFVLYTLNSANSPFYTMAVLAVSCRGELDIVAFDLSIRQIKIEIK
jgi:hypothetical protein